MNIQNLVRMANQIGQYFETLPDRDQAVSDIATHLALFWEPRMRKQLILHVEQSHDSGLKQIVLESLRLHKLALGSLKNTQEISPAKA
ncbi:MAG: formate dehydrogenase subunit delta [Gammaproteobacteria bacterium]|nr:formate dehydrogenase subunit delta [Gammaproteobacteria bacterium]MBL7000902.1 formate dehydrogenase subunit delta [Gammaproteobacteria bacterium]